ncbi:MAG TPA: response regulator [Planctomycetaceae bacterium]|nr:response regulator [Planctomycetaceae bacterium]
MRELPAPVVHIVDDDRDMRDSLAFLLRSVDIGVQVYATATEFLALYRSDQPGCLLFDVRMPDISGLELYERLVADGVTLPVIFMTAYADVPMAVRALKSGAVEFLEKPFNRQMLLERVQKAIADDVARRQLGEQWEDVARRMSDLTERERNVLEMVLTGVPNKAIASKLEITERTVELRRASLMKKLDVTSAVELIRLMTQYEIFSETRRSMSPHAIGTAFPRQDPHSPQS